MEIEGAVHQDSAAADKRGYLESASSVFSNKNKRSVMCSHGSNDQPKLVMEAPSEPPLRSVQGPADR